jgi:hypothetical protein
MTRMCIANETPLAAKANVHYSFNGGSYYTDVRPIGEALLAAASMRLNGYTDAHVVEVVE